MTFYEAILGIEIPNEFGIWEDDDSLTSSAECYVEKVLALAKSMNIKISYSYGVSQICFILENQPKVIKIGFDGRMYYNEYYDEETDSYIDSDPEFEEYSINYTEKAQSIYDLAVSKGVEEFFAKTELLGTTFCNQPVWAQEFVYPFDTQHTSTTKPSKKSYDLAKKSYLPFSIEWIATAIEIYGEDKVKALSNFIEDNDLNDFHSGNYGWDLVGNPKIFDFSGFNPD